MWVLHLPTGFIMKIDDAIFTDPTVTEIRADLIDGCPINLPTANCSGCIFQTPEQFGCCGNSPRETWFKECMAKDSFEPIDITTTIYYEKIKRLPT